MNQKKWLKVLTAGLIMLFAFSLYPMKALAANPYLPMWEYIPDGEPYVFEDPENPGKYRAYIYGSHDTFRDKFCGEDIVVWSAPVEDLTNWRYEGVAFESIVNGVADVLFAPDIAEKIEADGSKTYYLYPNNQGGGRNSMVAKSDSPIGPFEVINFRRGSTTSTEGILGFDPAVFIDDDGRVYGYWGFQKSFAAELNPDTMATVKEGTKIIEGMVSHSDEEGDFRFFEASSMRKVKDKYIFVYSRVSKDGEFGLPGSNNTLAYAYSDSPLGPWTYGGTLVDARSRDKDADRNVIATVQSWGNTHGSILEINGGWYVFYHRQTNNSMYSRQAMVAPIQVEVTEGKGGKVTITEAEVTSEGFEIGGLNPYNNHSAGIACWYTGGPYIKATYDREVNSNPVVNNTNGSIVGYKYFNFDLLTNPGDTKLLVNLIPKGKDATIDIMMDSPWASRGGVLLGSISIAKTDARALTVKEASLTNLKGVNGKHSIYFVFKSSTGGEICELHNFKFSNEDNASQGTLDIEDKQFISYEKVNAFIDAIGTVEYNTKSKSLIDQARKAYEILTEKQKKLVTNRDKLFIAEDEYIRLNEKTLVDAGKNYEGFVIINGDFEKDSEDWNANNSATLQIIDNDAYTGKRSMLVSGRTETASGVKQDVTGRITTDVSYTVSAKVKYIEGTDNRDFIICLNNNRTGAVQILASGNITKGEWGTIEGVFTLPSGTDLYSNSISVETSGVASPTKQNDLMDFYLDDMTLMKTVDMNAASVVIELIEAIGKVQKSDTSKELIDAARTAYDSLTQTQKNLITNKSELFSAEMIYKRLLKSDGGSKFQQHQDQMAADEVIKLIDAIGTVENNDNSKNLIEAAKKGYNALNEAQMNLVTNSNKLKEAEDRYNNPASDQKRNPLIMVTIIGLFVILTGGGLIVYKKRH